MTKLRQLHFPSTFRAAASGQTEEDKILESIQGILHEERTANSSFQSNTMHGRVINILETIAQTASRNAEKIKQENGELNIEFDKLQQVLQKLESSLRIVPPRSTMTPPAAQSSSAPRTNFVGPALTPTPEFYTQQRTGNRKAPVGGGATSSGGGDSSGGGGSSRVLPFREFASRRGYNT